MTSRTSPQESAGPRTRRPGLPSLRGNTSMVNAAVIDSLGTGLVLAFILIYFARTTSLSLPAIGAALTLARLLAVPTAIVVGPLIDRWGARRVAAAGNAISAVAYAGFLASHQVWQIVLVGWLTQVGAASYWTSSTGLVVLATEPRGRPRWFAMLHMLRSSGLAIGGAIGALLVGIEGTAGLRIVVLVNAASYALATVLLARWRPPFAPSPGPAQTPTQAGKRAVGRGKGSYRTVFRDRRYLLLVAINVNFVFGALILSLLLAIFVTDGLHQPAWIGGLLLVVNSVQVALTQTTVNRRMERYRPIRVLIASCGLNAAAFGVFAVIGAAPGWLALTGLTIGMLIYNLAETTATPFSEDLSVSLAPEGLRGRYLAVYQLSWTFGQTAAPAVFTLLLVLGRSWPWIFLVLVSLLAIPALFRLERMMPATSDEVPPEVDRQPSAA